MALIRKNATRDMLGAFFGVSQPTVSRRWDLLLPAIDETLAEFVIDPKDLIGDATVLVDGTICPTWDWKQSPTCSPARQAIPA